MASNRKQSSQPDKAVDALLDEFLKGHRPQDILDEGGLVQDLTRRLVQRALEGEMTDHLGYGAHAVEGRDNGNSRNGKSRKKVKTGSGEVEIEVPRDRDGSFEPRLVPKHCRRLPGFDDKVISFYARGMTTREIESELQEIYGVDVSPSLISAVTDSVLDDVRAWQSRPLDSVYPIIFLDAIHVKMRSSGHVQNTAVYVAVAITMEDEKELLGLWIGEGENEGAKFWLSVLTELKNRGVEDILIAAVDGLKGFPEAIEAAFPATQVQVCVVHMVRHSLRYVPWKLRKKVAAALRNIYTAKTRELAATALDDFEETWGDEYPKIVKSWRGNWTNLTRYFDYPPEIRRLIYTTNTVESINAQLRKVVKKRGAFPTEDSVRKVMYLAMTRAAQRWKRPVREWPKVLNHLAIVFEGRVPL